MYKYIDLLYLIHKSSLLMSPTLRFELRQEAYEKTVGVGAKLDNILTARSSSLTRSTRRCSLGLYVYIPCIYQSKL